MASSGALAMIDPEPILQRINRGDSLRTIAADLNVSNVGLRAWLLREDAERYAEVVTAALTQRVAEADDRLEDAEDAVSIARAREMARFARMDLERRRPALYGQRTQVTHEVGPDLGEVLMKAQQRVAQRTHAAALTPPEVEDAQIVDR